MKRCTVLLWPTLCKGTRFLGYHDVPGSWRNGWVKTEARWGFWSKRKTRSMRGK